MCFGTAQVKQHYIADIETGDAVSGALYESDTLLDSELMAA